MSCTPNQAVQTDSDPSVLYYLNKCPEGWAGSDITNRVKASEGRCTSTGINNATNQKANAFPVCSKGDVTISCPGSDFGTFVATSNARHDAAYGLGAGVCVSAKDGTALVASQCERPTGCAFVTKSVTDPSPRDTPPVAAYQCTPDGKDYACQVDTFVCDTRYGLCRHTSVIDTPDFAYIPRDSKQSTFAGCTGACKPDMYDCTQDAKGDYGCVVSSTGQNKYEDCIKQPNCTPQKWACTEKGCATDANGKYDSQSACAAVCKPRCDASSYSCLPFSDRTDLQPYDDAQSCAQGCVRTAMPSGMIALIVVVAVVVACILLGAVYFAVQHFRRPR